VRESRTLGLLGRKGKAALKSERDVRDALASLHHRKPGRGGLDGLEEQVVLTLLDPVPLDGVCEKS
jgi:hypothetical protein